MLLLRLLVDRNSSQDRRAFPSSEKAQDTAVLVYLYTRRVRVRLRGHHLVCDDGGAVIQDEDHPTRERYLVRGAGLDDVNS